MDLHLRQQFDFLLATAVQRYVERLEQRNEGAENALQRLAEQPNAEGVWLDDFVNAVFQDFLLDNGAGACFVLQALEKRSHREIPAGQVADSLITLAKAAFAELLQSKTLETLEQRSGYHGLQT